MFVTGHFPLSGASQEGDDQMASNNGIYPAARVGTIAGEAACTYPVFGLH